jgi:hypothetical protein
VAKTDERTMGGDRRPSPTTQAFEALVAAYGSKNWDGIMAAIADDAKLESRADGSSQTLGKEAYGKAIKPIVADTRSMRVEHTKIKMVSPTQAQVSGTFTIDVAFTDPFSAPRLWERERRGDRWLVVRSGHRNLF